MSAKITKIEIEVGGKKIDLTLDEARELYDELDSVFRKATPLPYIPLTPYIPPYLPYRWYDDNLPKYTITSTGDSVGKEKEISWISGPESG